MLPYPTYSTPATDSLCKAIAKKSKGVCFLGFSRGKDSVCAWLQLRRYFRRIIPFHCASLPGLRYAEEALRYYEGEFGTHILRMMDTSLSHDLQRGIYQLPMDMPYIRGLEMRDFDKLQVVEYLRYVYGLPNAWCAFGINASDSIDRHLNCVESGGRHDSNKSFYPTWDWPRAKIRETVAECGLRLSSEYRHSDTTMEGTPCATYIRILRDHYPEDFALTKAYYPLCEAKDYRERLNEAVHERRRREKLEERGGVSTGAHALLRFADGYGLWNYTSLFDARASRDYAAAAEAQRVYNFKKRGYLSSVVKAAVEAAAEALGCDAIVACPGHTPERTRLQEMFGAELTRQTEVMSRKYNHGTDIDYGFESATLALADGFSAKRALVVDDVATTGKTLRFYKRFLSERGVDSVAFAIGVSGKLKPTRDGPQIESRGTKDERE